jgi:hypothetical protein
MSNAKKLVPCETPLTQNRQSQKGQWTWGCKGKDRTTDMKEAPSGCGEWNGKGANGPREGEGTSQSKLRKMGMMGGWMEVGAHLSTGIKLTTGSPSDGYWDDWDAW